jgi:hypothetical protein
MDCDLKKFQESLPQFFYPILDELLGQGLRPILVGGVVRDFILTGKIGSDWDVELHHETLPFEKGFWKSLGKSLSKFGKTTFLPYEVIRLVRDSYQVEFSPPRLEHFHENAGGHSNFDAEFIFNLPFKKGVQRRDFTINSMGLFFKSKKEILFLDPLDGLSDLSENQLHQCGQDFSKDPVRYLRAHRFQLKYHLAFSPELKNELDSMALEGVTPTYLWSEMQKSTDPLKYLSVLSGDKKRGLELPVGEDFFKMIDDLRPILIDQTRHELWLVALEWVGLSGEKWGQYFSLSEELYKRLSRWVRVSKELMKFDPQDFQGEFSVMKDSTDFEKLFDWYFTTKQLLQKNPGLPLIKIMSQYLPHWVLLFQFEAPKEVKHIDPPLRAKYQVWNLCQRL